MGNIAQRIRNRRYIALCIAGIRRDIAHPVGFRRVESITVHREDLFISGSISCLHKLSSLGILVGCHISTCVCSGNHASLTIIGKPSSIAQRIGHRGAVAHVVIGIGGCITQSVSGRGHIPAAVIFIIGGIAPAIRSGKHVPLVIIGVGNFVPIAVLHPGNHTVGVVGIFFFRAVRIRSRGNISLFIIFVFGSVSFTVRIGGNLIEFVILIFSCAIRIGCLCDPAHSIVPDFQKIPICTGANVVAGIKIVTIIKSSDVGGILVDHTPHIIIGVLDINIAFKIGNRCQVPICIGIAQTVTIRVFYSGQIVAVIG